MFYKRELRGKLGIYVNVTVEEEITKRKLDVLPGVHL